MEQQQVTIKPLRLKMNDLFVGEFEALQIKDASDNFVTFFNQDFVNKHVEQLQKEIEELKAKLKNE